MYDITKNKNRRKVAQKLLDNGLRRVQYSGFLGAMNVHDRTTLGQVVKPYITDPNDCLFIIPLCIQCLKKVVVVTNKLNPFITEASRIFIVV